MKRLQLAGVRKAWRPLVSATTILTVSTVGVLATAASSAASSPVQVLFWAGHSSGELHRALVAEVAQFNKTHPGIHVTFKPIGASKHGLAAFESGKAPNVAMLTYPVHFQFEKAGAILNLKPYIDGKNGLTPKEIAADYYPAVWRAMTDANGAQYLLPLEKKSLLVIYYNEALFKKAHIASPPKTWAEVGKDAAIITKLGSKYHGIAWTPSLRQYFDITLADGGHVFRPGPHRTTFDLQNKGAAAALRMLRAWIKSGEMILTSGYQYQLDFGTGYVGMLIDASAGYTYDKSAIGGKFAMGGAPSPEGTSGHSSQEINGNSLALFNDGTAAQKAAAWTFMKYLSSPSTNYYWDTHTGYLPLGPATYAMMKSFYAKHPAQAAAFSNPNGWWSKARSPNWTAAITAMTAVFEKAIKGQITVAQALHQMDLAGTSYLSGKVRG